ncbi:MAG: biotin/lipoyl-binding protein, partial [Planctomycetales bacterium]
MNRPTSPPDPDVLRTLSGGRANWGKRLGCFLVVALLAGAGAGAYPTAVWYFQPKPIVYRVLQASRGDLTLTVTATGDLEPTNVVEVGCQVSGRIQTVEVDFNDPVKKGQLLVTLDVEELVAQVSKSKASLQVVQADLKQAE